MSKTTQTQQPNRYDRLKLVLETLVGQAEFELAKIKSECAGERPGFVTRIVNELAQNGWLLRESEDSSMVYRWNKGRGDFSISRWLDDKLFGSQVKLAPKDERPRERLLACGASQLRTSELLAILVRSGRPGESAVAAGEKIAKYFQNRLEALPQAGRGELKSISPAIQATAYCQIMAGIELGRRVAAVSDDRITTKIASSQQAVEFCCRHFSRLANDAKQEEFHIVTLDTKNQVIDTHQITIGTLNASLVHPREVFRPAIKDAAASILLVHNHPSGDPSPSQEDIQVTKRIRQAGETLGIEVLDHIVLGRQTGVSLKEQHQI